MHSTAMPLFAISHAATGLSIPPDINAIPFPEEPTGNPPYVLITFEKTYASFLSSTLNTTLGLCTFTVKFSILSSIYPPISAATSLDVNGNLLSALFTSTLNVVFCSLKNIFICFNATFLRFSIDWSVVFTPGQTPTKPNIGTILGITLS